MAHTYDVWTVTLKSGAVVHFTSKKEAVKYYDSEDMVTHEVKTSPCYKPARGYCGLCYPFREHAGNPDYTESDSHIPPEVSSRW